MIKLSREETMFVTPECILSFPALFPGEAQDSEVSAGSKVYKCEGICSKITEDDQIAKVTTLVAKTFDEKNWKKHVFGANGRIRLLEEMPGRDPAKYPYAVGKYVLGFSKTISLKFLNMQDANLADPVQKAKYDAEVNAQAPRIKKFVNPNNPADLSKLREKIEEMALKGKPVPQESEYSKQLIDVEPHEIWPGCIVKIQGHAYWQDNKTNKRVLFGLDNILFVREGERLVADTDPDSAFAAFAPDAGLAPDAWSAAV